MQSATGLCVYGSVRRAQPLGQVIAMSRTRPRSAVAELVHAHLI